MAMRMISMHVPRARLQLTPATYLSKLPAPLPSAMTVTGTRKGNTLFDCCSVDGVLHLGVFEAGSPNCRNAGVTLRAAYESVHHVDAVRSWPLPRLSPIGFITRSRSQHDSTCGCARGDWLGLARMADIRLPWPLCQHESNNFIKLPRRRPASDGRRSGQTPNHVILHSTAPCAHSCHNSDFNSCSLLIRIAKNNNAPRW